MRRKEAQGRENSGSTLSPASVFSLGEVEVALAFNIGKMQRRL